MLGILVVCTAVLGVLVVCRAVLGVLVVCTVVVCVVTTGAVAVLAVPGTMWPCRCRYRVSSAETDTKYTCTQATQRKAKICATNCRLNIS